jgi:hypothetical protein
MDNLELNSYDQPNILFLKGCFVEDCSSIEDIFDENLVNQSLTEDELYNTQDIVFDNIPKQFTTVDTWIKKTNLKCWSCDCNFHNVPVFIPMSIERSDSTEVLTGSMDTLGNFCSWNCASQYINLHFSATKKWERHESLKLLYKIFTNISIDEIVQSPPKTIMKQYGGNQTQAEYMDGLMKLNDYYKRSIQHSSISYITK